MTGAIVTLSLALALGGAGQCPDPSRCPRHGHSHAHGHPRPHGHGHGHGSGGFILPPGPGNGYGFPNGNPDGYGWADYGHYLPIREDRTSEYYVPRYFMLPPEQLFLSSYYNPYVTSGQRYIPYVGAGGDHAAGGPPQDGAQLPMYPYTEQVKNRLPVQVPRLNGRVEASPINSGATGLTP